MVCQHCRWKITLLWHCAGPTDQFWASTKYIMLPSWCCELWGVQDQSWGPKFIFIRALKTLGFSDLTFLQRRKPLGKKRVECCSSYHYSFSLVFIFKRNSNISGTWSVVHFLCLGRGWQKALCTDIGRLLSNPPQYTPNFPKVIMPLATTQSTENTSSLLDSDSEGRSLMTELCGLLLLSLHCSRVGVFMKLAVHFQVHLLTWVYNILFCLLQPTV